MTLPQTSIPAESGLRNVALSRRSVLRCPATCLHSCSVLFECDNGQAGDPREVSVAGHQSGSQSQSCSRHPQIVLVECESLLLPGRFEIRVQVRSALRDRFAMECFQESKTAIERYQMIFRPELWCR